MSRSIPEWVRQTLQLDVASAQLFVQALTHASSTEGPDYERLEFLGDAVLKLVVSDWIYECYPSMSEGEMTKIRAKIVSDAILGTIAQRLDLGLVLRLGAAEKRTGGKKKVGTLAAALEAVLAATYLTLGLESAKALIRRLWASELETAATAPGAENAKAILQEITQERFAILPVYRVVGGEGPQHQHTFFVEVEVQGRVYGHGKGRTKKEAEQAAASQALVALERSQACPPSS